MSFAKFLSVIALAIVVTGCANDGTAPNWEGYAILPNMTNIPTVHYTPDGFDTPYDYY